MAPPARASRRLGAVLAATRPRGAAAAQKSPTEPLDLAVKARAIAEGRQPADHTYPYIVLDHTLESPFLHIGGEKQLLLDNFILDHLDGVQRTLPTPAKAEEPLLSWSDLPWEQTAWNPGITGAIRDPGDGLFKMWYWQSLTGDPFNTGQALCYAESADALHWHKPLRAECHDFEGHTRTNIVHRDVSHSGLVLNHDQSDPTKKFLLLNAAPATAAKNGDNPLHPQFKGSRRLSQVEASADGVVWRLLSEASEFPHHHEQRILWDPAIREWVGYSQVIPPPSHLLGHRVVVGLTPNSERMVAVLAPSEPGA